MGSLKLKTQIASLREQRRIAKEQSISIETLTQLNPEHEVNEIPQQVSANSISKEDRHDPEKVINRLRSLAANLPQTKEGPELFEQEYLGIQDELCRLAHSMNCSREYDKSDVAKVSDYRVEESFAFSTFKGKEAVRRVRINTNGKAKCVDSLQSVIQEKTPQITRLDNAPIDLNSYRQGLKQVESLETVSQVKDQGTKDYSQEAARYISRMVYQGEDKKESNPTCHVALSLLNNN